MSPSEFWPHMGNCGEIIKFHDFWPKRLLRTQTEKQTLTKAKNPCVTMWKRSKSTKIQKNQVLFPHFAIFRPKNGEKNACSGCHTTLKTVVLRSGSIGLVSKMGMTRPNIIRLACC